MECAEIINHTPWKHWKHQEPRDDDAIAMELVDIWHFAMAHAMTFPDFISLKLYNDMQYAEDHCDPDSGATIIQLCINIGNSMYKDQCFLIGNFYMLMRIVGMDFDDLYRLYIGKNVLNWFRQDHGYKEGLYIKHWDGKEDNEHLFEITKMLGDNFDSIELVKSLSARYALAGH